MDAHIEKERHRGHLPSCGLRSLARVNEPTTVKSPDLQPEQEKGLAAAIWSRWQVRLAATIAAAGLVLIAVWAMTGDYHPADPNECAALHEQAREDRDLVYEIDYRGCPDAPVQPAASQYPAAQ